MKILQRLGALGIACGTLHLAGIGLAAPPLTDFGYANMRTDRTLYLAIILVNFTNTPVPSSVATPYVMGTTPVGANYAAAEQWYTNWFLAVNGSTNPTVNGYLHEASNGRMGCRLAGLTMLTLDTNLNYAGVAARAGGPGGTADRIYASNFLWLAASKAGFATVTNRDLNHNGTITDAECCLVLLSNDKTIGGGTRYPGLLPLPNTTTKWLTPFTFQAVDDTPLCVVNHELIHVLQGGHSRDIYGPDSSLSEGFTIMSGGRKITHPDAWHKLQLAWCEPRIHSLREPGLLQLPAAQLMQSNGPVILYDPQDPQRNTTEFFILEYRTTNTITAGRGYDWEVGNGTSGLVIWHVRHNSNKDPVEYTQTFYPSAETQWRECLHCQGLFHTAGSSLACPRTNNAAHEALSSRLCLPANDPSVEGVPGWRRCVDCSQLFYLPNLASSVCAKGGQHASTSAEYRLRFDSDPEALGPPGWRHCGKCQCLVNGEGVCPAGGVHVMAAGTPTYTLFWWDHVFAIMTAGAPDLARGRGDAWGSGSITPMLRYYDGSECLTRLRVLPFPSDADEITVEVQPNYEIWVDFSYSGFEDGSFDHPFNLLSEGVNAVASGGSLMIKFSYSPLPAHITKPMRIRAYGGPALIGRNP
jgi:M6 family metalloprotease-like protein